MIRTCFAVANPFVAFSKLADSASRNKRAKKKITEFIFCGSLRVGVTRVQTMSATPLKKKNCKIAFFLFAFFSSEIYDIMI